MSAPSLAPSLRSGLATLGSRAGLGGFRRLEDTLWQKCRQERMAL